MIAPITLSDGVTSIDLPGDLEWIDEHDWSAVESVMVRSLTGRMIIQSQARVAGRPITLEPHQGTGSWMTRGTYKLLKPWLDAPGQILTLTLHGESYQVAFRHHEEPAASGRAVLFYSDPTDLHKMQGTFKFITVEA